MKKYFVLATCLLISNAQPEQAKKLEDMQMSFERHDYQEFQEAPFFGGMSVRIPITKKLEEVQSPYQKIEMYETVPFGNMMVIDDIIMLTQFDNAAYHEMMVHVPMQAHPNPKRVLIVGGGDGGALKEILKYDSVVEVVMCEIDMKVIELSKKYLPEFAPGFKDPRVKIVAADAAQYVENKKNYFDVICCDSTDNFGPAAVLFQRPFYENVHSALTEDGIAVTQSESIYYNRDLITALYQQNNEIFKYASYYYTLIPTYPSGTIGYSFCSKKYSPFDNFDPTRAAQLKNCDYYNADMHRAGFMLPTFIKKLLK